MDPLLFDDLDQAQEIHAWAQDVLRANDTCGVGRTLDGRYVVIWPGLIDHWIGAPEGRGCYVGTLDRKSTVADVRRLLKEAS